jgi:hypothetical protein
LLLQKVKVGDLTRTQALKKIGAARQQSEKVVRLLKALGDGEETAPLAARFRRTAKRLEQSQLDAKTGALFGQLTLAFHDLNLTLNTAFYPAPHE